MWVDLVYSLVAVCVCDLLQRVGAGGFDLEQSDPVRDGLHRFLDLLFDDRRARSGHARARRLASTNRAF